MEDSESRIRSIESLIIDPDPGGFFLTNFSPTTLPGTQKRVAQTQHSLQEHQNGIVNCNGRKPLHSGIVSCENSSLIKSLLNPGQEIGNVGNSLISYSSLSFHGSK